MVVRLARCALHVAVLVGVATATNYYFSSSSGDDSRTTTTSAAPWASIAKANTLTLTAGDSVLFKCGDTFRGALQVRGSNVVYSSYGAGSPPVINGTTAIGGTGWTPVGNGIYRAPVTHRVRQLFLDGEPMTLGRFPNVGYLSVDSATSSLRGFTDAALSGGPNWSGASLHIRTEPWSLDARVVTAHSGAAITLDRDCNYEINPAEAYFINNDIDAVDSAGEWYWDSTGGTVSFVTPDGTTPRLRLVEATVEDIGIDVQNRSNVIIDGLAVFGHFSYGIRVGGSSRACTIRNCSVRFAYGTGLYAGGSDSMRVENTVIDGANYYGLELRASRSVATGNTIRRIGMVGRLGASGLGGGCCAARGLDISGRLNQVTYNRLDSIGYNAIGFGGPNQLIERNTVTYYCLTTYDGSAIYTWSANYADSGAMGTMIRENIITGGAGPGRAVVAPGWWSNGIYLDDRTHDITVENNTVSNAYHGIYLHNTKRHVARGNTVFDCTDHSLLFSQDQNGAAGQMADNVVVSNDVFALSRTYRCVRINDQFNTPAFFSRLDSNQYWNVYSSFAASRSYRPGYPGDLANDNRQFSLEQWRGVSSYDLHSGTNPSIWNNWSVRDTQGTEMITNGTFNTSTTGWSCWAESSACAMSWTQNGGQSGGGLVTSMINKPGVTYALLISSKFALVQGASYLLAFDIRGSRSSGVTVYPRMNHAPWSSLAPSVDMMIDTGWTRQALAFTATASDTSARIDFEYDRGDSTWWLDNVSLLRVTLDSVDNRALVRLVSNPSTSAASVALAPGVWKDLRGTTFRGSINLAPYRSRILYLDSGAAAVNRPGRAMSAAVAPSLRCRVSSNGVVVMYVGAAPGADVRLMVVAMDGRVAFSREIGAGAGGRIVWQRRPGAGSGTMLVVAESGGSRTVRRIVVR